MPSSVSVVRNQSRPSSTAHATFAAVVISAASEQPVIVVVAVVVVPTGGIVEPPRGVGVAGLEIPPPSRHYSRVAIPREVRESFWAFPVIAAWVEVAAEPVAAFGVVEGGDYCVAVGTSTLCVGGSRVR